MSVSGREVSGTGGGRSGRWCGRIGRSSATGSPLRVTMNVSPTVTASITIALSLRSSRCAIVLATTQSWQAKLHMAT
jgi:hypothetical protein